MAQSLNQDAANAFAARVGEGPVVMLNLLKFKADGGAAMYRKYMAAAEPLVRGVGGEVSYMGSAGAALLGQADWDLVLLVRYPDRASLLAMSQSDEYQAILPLRTNSLADSVLLETTPK